MTIQPRGVYSENIHLMLDDWDLKQIEHAKKQKEKAKAKALAEELSKQMEAVKGRFPGAWGN